MLFLFHAAQFMVLFWMWNKQQLIIYTHKTGETQRWMTWAVARLMGAEIGVQNDPSRPGHTVLDFLTTWPIGNR